MNERLRQLLVAILGRCGSLSRTNLMKLVYLIDWEYAKRNGRTYTGLEYTFYHYGPFAAEVTQIASSAELGFHVVPYLSYGGNMGYSHSLLDPNLDDVVGLPSEVWYTVDKVFSQVDHRNLEELLEYVYSTEPMQSANRGEVLNMTKGIENDIRRRRLVRQARVNERRTRSATTLHPDDARELDDETRAVIYAQPLFDDAEE